MNSQQKFLSLLRDDILKLDSADLDFGIYRILNYRREEIQKFLEEDLPKKLSEVMGKQISAQAQEEKDKLTRLRSELNKTSQSLGEDSAFEGESLKEQFRNFGKGKEYIETQRIVERLEAEDEVSQSEEENLYNHLHTFFSRYYEDGDFMIQPRRGVKTMVPYSGEDVHFYWQSQGSHYVKTSLEFKSYSFIEGSWRVIFELVNVDEEKDNVKGKTRYFIPVPNKLKVDTEAKKVTLPLEFRPLTSTEAKKYDKNNEGTIQEQIIDTFLSAKKDDLPLAKDVLRRHMRRYTKKNRADFFVHPGLGSFLQKELDAYLKEEYLNPDALTSPESIHTRFSKYRVLKEMGYEIIKFLDQIESFQARIFEKRRFVTGVEYLVPLHHVSPQLWKEILDSKEQIGEWRDLFAIKGDIGEKFLKTHPSLVVNTKHFEESVRQQILGSFDDLEKAVGGVLINGENYGTLRTIGEKYKGQIKAIYIDPPYNTGSDRFLYKDDFSRHSTWLAMMKERLEQGLKVIRNDGAIFISIDDNEAARLMLLLNQVLGEDNHIENVIWRKKSGGGQQDDYLVTEHDYVLFWAKNKANFKLIEKTIEKSKKGYPRFDKEKNKNYKQVKLAKWGTAAHREDRPTMYFSIIDPEGNENYPIAPDGRPGRWRYGKATVKRMVAKNEIDWVHKDGEWLAYEKDYEPNEGDIKVLKERSIIYDLVENTAGSNELKDLFGIKDVFENPKPSDLIYHLFLLTQGFDEWAMDFFAGSGTTGQAVINLNREDGGNRKFILVEMGEYFDSVLLPRIQKLMYAPEWDEGTPAEDPSVGQTAIDEVLPEWMERSPSLVKVIRLESYDDSLNALEIPKLREARRAGQKPLFQEYALQYLLMEETAGSNVLLNTEKLEDPFNYQLEIHTPNGLEYTSVDLVETFNLLMGLHVKRITVQFNEKDDNRRYVVVDALNSGQPALVIWRSTKDLNPSTEMEFVARNFNLSDYSTVYYNADMALPSGSSGRSLDPLFKAKMFEGATGA